MAAITSKLQILATDNRSGKSKKTGDAYSMDVAQCAVHFADGKLLVGDLVLPKGMPVPKPGFYDAVFEVGVSFQKQVAGYLVSLIPCAQPAPAVLKPA